MSKNIKSMALSVAGIMIAAPAGAEIASTDYVDRVIGETHIQGSVLQFDKLTDEPAFILGATGTGVSNYGAVSIAELGLTLGSQIAGSAITGFATGSGSFVLVGDGTTTGSAMWQGMSTIGSQIAGYEGYSVGSGTLNLLAGGGGTENTAGWIGVNELALQLPGSWIAGFGSFFLNKNDDSASARYILGQVTEDSSQLASQSAEWFRVNRLGKYMAGFDTVASNSEAMGVTHFLGGASGTDSVPKWTSVRDLGRYLPGSSISQYGSGLGNYILVGRSGAAEDIPGWRHISEILLSGLRGENYDTAFNANTWKDTFLVSDKTRSGSAYWAGIDWLMERMPGSVISHYGNSIQENTEGTVYMLGGDGTESGSARWLTPGDVAYSIPGSYLAGFDSGSVNGSAEYQQPMYILGQNGYNDKESLKMQSPAWYSLGQVGNNLAGFNKYTGSFTGDINEDNLSVLIGSGVSTGNAQWASMVDVLYSGVHKTYLDDYNGIGVLMRTMRSGDVAWREASTLSQFVNGASITGYGTGTGSFVLVGDGTENSGANWSTIPRMVMVNPLYSGTGEFVFIGFDDEDENEKLIGMRPGQFKQYFMGDAGSYIAGYGTGSGSYVLVGRSTDDRARWSSVTEMLRNGLSNTPSNDELSVPVHYPGKNIFNYLTPEAFVRQMVPGSVISRYGTGTGSYVLVGSTTTSGAHYMGASNLSQYMQGSAISGYNTVTGQPSYILGSSASGTGATPALYPMSGLGSKIEFKETKTAAQLSASTGTIYFPVIQDGKIYGVTLNDFYILMNAQF